MEKKLWNIQMRGLRLGYGEKVVLENVEAELPAAKISVILGGSGGGKSTLLRHIIGLSRPMSGQILLGGHDIFALSTAAFRRIRRRMGVLFQDGALLGSLTLGQNVGLPLKEHTNMPDKTIREIVLHKLALVGLADFIDYFPNELSGGMRKRAGLARAVVTDPPILLCDEPTSGLDPINAAQMDELLLSMKRRFPSMTIVSVSHDMASVKAIADHVLVLNNKSVAYNGDLRGLETSSDEYLRHFLQRTPLRREAAEDPRLALSAQTQALMQKSLDSWLEKK